MITTMFSAMMVLSILFITMNHPLSAGLILLLQTVIISMITGNLNYNFWFSYILFLIMIGGMLILFMYMTSIASNEKFKMSNMNLMLILITPVITLMLQKMEINIKNNESMKFDEMISINTSFSKYINMPLSLTLIFMMIYLLLALIATVKITSFKQGSIRQMN
uniref:NADH dehydrogenase subunit 6 n=1 Tax=Heterotarsus carinula TaxID=1885609 RepID=UPI0021769A8F|nr:NADH dehydrogenase subunit 6 [Heterotarsus carinula]UUL71701.1 NADH dehydrogenase subunit 6 [Heterotarsus carinula]